MENEKETKLEASGRFAEIGATQIKKARRRLNHRDDSHILAASKSNLQSTNLICAQRAGSSVASVILEHQDWSRPRQPHATSCYRLS
jgi:hypothetical protein